MTEELTNDEIQAINRALGDIGLYSDQRNRIIGVIKENQENAKGWADMVALLDTKDIKNPKLFKDSFVMLKKVQKIMLDIEPKSEEEMKKPKTIDWKVLRDIFYGDKKE